MEIIIKAFKENRFREKQQSQSYSHHYTDLIKFRFLTGLRISESIALTWDDIIYDENNNPVLIQLNKAYLEGELQLHTKTYKNRHFPINDSLKHFLLNIPHKSSQHNLIFPNTQGNYIHADTLSRIWRVIVTNLVKLGEVQQYLPLKDERHTFINQVIDNGLTDKETIALICGNSPQVIDSNYLRKKEEREKDIVKKLILPDFN